ncbi:hypothetical protein L3Q82_018625, partial [Scortum barcoo]
MERYSVQRVIGEGSFGRALLVRCKSSQEDYVLKEIRLPKSRPKLENSRREAVLLSRMKHPNIVAFREAFEADDLLCIVMEYCSGGDLLQRIRQQKTTQFSVDDILRWFAQMCAAGQHIHDKRVLHRDLKSKNIFLTDDGMVKLGDFGSACTLNSSKAYAQTYVGTPYYVAPEIWDNKPYNNKSDVWSLGCVLYELCTLQHPVFPLFRLSPNITNKSLRKTALLSSYCAVRYCKALLWNDGGPFQASSWKSLILKVCRGAYPPLPRHLPYELQYLVKQMFKTNPKDRPSLRTILTSHRVSRLLRTHLPPQAIETEEQGRHTGRWNREEGRKVADLLGEKSLIKTSTFEGRVQVKARSYLAPTLKAESRVLESSGPPSRRTPCCRCWPANASLISSDSRQRERQAARPSPVLLMEEPEHSRQRRRWDRDPPERLLSLLEKAQLSRGCSTFIIHKGGDDPLSGPLSQPQGDDTDGHEPEEAIDEERLRPRSDDED